MKNSILKNGIYGLLLMLPLVLQGAVPANMLTKIKKIQEKRRPAVTAAQSVQQVSNDATYKNNAQIMATKRLQLQQVLTAPDGASQRASILRSSEYQTTRDALAGYYKQSIRPKEQDYKQQLLGVKP